MKRVLIVGDFLHGSGVTSFILNAFGNINDQQIQFEALANAGSSEMKAEIEAKYGWPMTVIPAANQGLHSHLKAWHQFLKANRGRYDAVHFNYSAMWNFLPLMMAKHYGAKQITLHSHNTYFGTDGSAAKLRVLKLLHNFGKWYVCHFVATDFVAVSKEAAQWLFTGSIVKRQRYHLIRNGINLAKFNFDPEKRRRLRQAANLDGKHVYANVGVFEKRKNQQFLIKIFAKIAVQDPQAILYLIGTGPLETLLKQQVKAAKLTDQVQFLGRRSDMADLYQVMDYLIFPSLHEGLSMVFVEAQAAGLTIFPSAEIPLDRYDHEIVFPISLSKSANQWAEVIGQHQNSERRQGHIAALRRLGYDEKQTVKAIHALYQ
ncbi:hypothetical protein AYR56_09950 [Loigolactobacillus backii]|uniref:Glycosyl transferase family 1 domain-containing protein n=1 Tax=Loigolactobacillus backii TaxID=375175 RepID=A0A192H2F4_9LACO|nr:MULTISPECIES: glycosyltransferase [Loigolactobacillus]ANK62545.1 hypothetical protein AYR53_07050 [Loigolactobacillus backii]ANK70444.1 hypothetical protein AYR56_09950 [Loigolactobacillus backii]